MEYLAIKKQIKFFLDKWIKLEPATLNRVYQI